MDIMLVLL